MREYLFRGKCCGEWIEGSLIHAGSYVCILQDESKVHPMDFPYLDAECGIIDGKAEPVDPETVGQFTGLTDKNGSKIFEGDILDYWSSYNESLCESYEVVVFGVDNCSCCHAVYGWSTKNKYGYGRYIDSPENCVVVGNIHDNPELLEGE